MSIKLLSTLEGSENTVINSCCLTATNGMSVSGTSLLETVCASTCHRAPVGCFTTSVITPVVTISNEITVPNAFSTTDPSIGVSDNTAYGINISKTSGIGLLFNGTHRIVANGGGATVTGNVTMSGNAIINGGSICTAGNLSILNSGAAVEVQTGCLLTSNSYADASNIPACGIYSKGNICSIATVRGVNLCGTSTVGVNGITLRDSTDRSGLLAIQRKGSTTWSGAQICYSSTAEWSFMGNETQMGLYDDQQSEWALLYSENGGVCLYHSGSAKLCTCSTGAITAGVHCASTCLRSPIACGTTRVQSPLICATNCFRGTFICATSGFRTTGAGLRVCAGTGCGCGVDWIASSDCRCKKCIEEYNCGLEKVNALHPVTYQWKHDDTHDVGFIAQDVLEVEPMLVGGSEEDGYGLKYDKVTAVLVKAVQELSEKVCRLESKLIK